jgi:hypothetical protein
LQCEKLQGIPSQTRQCNKKSEMEAHLKKSAPQPITGDNPRLEGGFTGDGPPNDQCHIRAACAVHGHIIADASICKSQGTEIEDLALAQQFGPPKWKARQIDQGYHSEYQGIKAETDEPIEAITSHT